MNHSVNLTVRDFHLCSEWREDINGERFLDGTPKYVIDQSTGRKYLNESNALTRFKFVIFITVGTPVFHSISSVCHVVYRIFKLITVTHFWISKDNESSYSFTGRLEDAVLDLLKVAMALIVLIGLELSAVYGLFNPREGRKIFASLERFEFENIFLLSPCFQPDPTRHLFGSDFNQRDAF